MKLKLIYLIIFTVKVFGSGGYDHGTSAGKGNWDISLTWNPLNYFDQGQSYAILSYGLTNKMDFHAYYSSNKEGENNYYYGLFYQFLESNHLDLATAIGVRRYIKQTDIHFFFPQLLYTIYLMGNTRLGGSFVDIRSQSLKDHKGTAVDVFLSQKIYDNKNMKIDFSIGGFLPVLWAPKSGKWHPTYSIDISLKR